MTGSEIEKIRKQLGLTQAQFASLLGAHAVTVSRWESDLLHPTPYQLGLLHRFRRAMLQAQKKSHRVADDVAVALVTAGAIAGLYLLLRWAFDESGGEHEVLEPLGEDKLPAPEPEMEGEFVRPHTGRKHGGRRRGGEG